MRNCLPRLTLAFNKSSGRMGRIKAVGGASIARLHTHFSEGRMHIVTAIRFTPFCVNALLIYPDNRNLFSAGRPADPPFGSTSAS